MSRTLHKHFPAIKLCAEEKKNNKRKKMIEVCCDGNFTKAVAECCWNITHRRTPLSTNKIQQLKRHIVTEIVKQFHSYKTGKNCYSKRERIRIIITSITWSYSSGDI